MNLIENILWGPIGCIVIIAVAIGLLIKTDFFYIRHPIKTLMKNKSGNAVNMLSALGGSIGVGNIAGVALAVKLGGAGVVFWMWIFAFITMILKYAEIVIAVKYKHSGFGGAMFYLQNCKAGKLLSPLFCLFCIVSSFGIGCAVQSNACASAAGSAGISPLSCGIALAVFSSISVFGGGKRLQSISKYLVPAMSIIYIVASLTVIISNYANMPSVFAGIFKEAFSFKSIGGGLCFAAVKEGMSKGIFSSESGMGSSAIMYAYENDASPEDQGIYGIVEVFIDTVIMCTLTAFVILSTGVDTSGDIVYSAFASVFGTKSSYFIAFSLFCFSYTSICAWNFYGKCSLSFLTKSKAAMFIYNAAFIAVIIIGALSNLEPVWQFADICNALMLFVNIYAIVSLKKDISDPLKKSLK